MRQSVATHCCVQRKRPCVPPTNPSIARAVDQVASRPNECRGIPTGRQKVASAGRIARAGGAPLSASQGAAPRSGPSWRTRQWTGSI